MSATRNSGVVVMLKYGRVHISQILVFPNDDSRNRHEAKKKRQRLCEFFVVKGELLAVEEGIRESWHFPQSRLKTYTNLT